MSVTMITMKTKLKNWMRLGDSALCTSVTAKVDSI